jgi:hypothetical protein
MTNRSLLAGSSTRSRELFDWVSEMASFTKADRIPLDGLGLEQRAKDASPTQWMRSAHLSYLSQPLMAADRKRARRDRHGSYYGRPNCARRKIVSKAKPPRRIERAMEIRAFALKFLGERGRWQPLFNGPEVLRFEDSRFVMMFYVKRPGPLELRERSGPLGWGLYGLELWDKQLGKVLNLDWQTVGAVPRIVTFKRGDWEQRLLIG